MANAVFVAGLLVLGNAEPSTHSVVQSVDDQVQSWTYLGAEYGFVKNGVCEDYGMQSIHDAKKCEDAANSIGVNTVGVSSPFNFYDRTEFKNSGRPVGCSWHHFGNVEQWYDTTAACDDWGYSGCFCHISTPKVTEIIATTEPDSLKAMRAKELSRMTSYETTTFGLDNFDSQQQLEFTFGDESYLVQLFPKEHLTPNRIKHTNGHLDASSRWFTALDTPCHYSGHIVEPAHLSNMSAVALSLCPNRGVRGSILLGNDRLFINPAAYFLGSTHSHELGDEHIVYRASDFDSTGLPGASLSVQPQTVTESSSSRRSLIENTLSVDLSLELFLVIDPSVTEAYVSEHGSDYYQELAAWAVDTVNGASVAFEQWDDYSSTMGSIGVRIAEMEVLPNWNGEYRDLRPVDYAQKTEMDISPYVDKFSDWISNTGRDTHDTHHIFSFYKFASSTSGYAYYSCICKGWCAGLTSTTYSEAWNVRTFAHELGHNFGAKHDGTARGTSDNNCDTEAGIMGYGSNSNDWSSCTVGYWEDYYSASNGLTCMKNGFQDTVFDNVDVVIDDDDDSNSDTDCITVSGHNAATNGQYTASGANNGEVAYTRSGSWIYSVSSTDNGVTADWWVTSTTKGSSYWSTGWCGPNLNILQCSGNWEEYQNGGAFSSISSCGGSTVPSPTPRVTPSPVSTNSQSCVSIKSLSGRNGEYVYTGQSLNGQMVYYLGGNYLFYTYEAASSSYYWTFDTETFATANGNYGWNNGWCQSYGIAGCSGSWKFNSGSDNNCVFAATCSAFEEDSELECVTNNEYEANVCIESSHNASLWSGLVQFSVSLEECAEELPMFTATVDGVDYFLYANVYREFVDSETTSTRWVISSDHLRATAQLAICEEADLADCSAGNWNVREQLDDGIVMAIDAEMTFLDRECVVSEDSANSNADDDSTVTWIAVALVVALVILGVAVIVVMRGRRSKVEVGFEDKDEIELEMDPENVEEAMNATTTV